MNIMKSVEYLLIFQSSSIRFCSCQCNKFNEAFDEKREKGDGNRSDTKRFKKRRNSRREYEYKLSENLRKNVDENLFSTHIICVVSSDDRLR